MTSLLLSHISNASDITAVYGSVSVGIFCVINSIDYISSVTYFAGFSYVGGFLSISLVAYF